MNRVVVYSRHHFHKVQHGGKPWLRTDIAMATSIHGGIMTTNPNLMVEIFAFTRERFLRGVDRRKADVFIAQLINIIMARGAPRKDRIDCALRLSEEKGMKLSRKNIVELINTYSK